MNHEKNRKKFFDEFWEAYFYSKKCHIYVFTLVLTILSRNCLGNESQNSSYIKNYFKIRNACVDGKVVRCYNKLLICKIIECFVFGCK